MANSEQFFWKKTVRPDDKPERKILPNALVEYSNSFFNHRLGLIASFNESNSYNEQRQFVPAYDTTPTAADPRPIVLTRIQYKDGPKFSERTTGSFTLDFKATPELSFSLLGTINTYDAFVANRSFGVSTTRANLINSDGWTSWNNVPVTAFTAAASAAYLNKRTHGWTYLPSVEYKTHNLLITGAAVISSSENNYAGGQSKSWPGNNLGGVSLATTGMTVRAARTGDDLYSWQVVQTGGLDWANLANYKAAATATPTFAVDGRYNRTLIYQGKLDAKYITPLQMPTWLKAGGKVSETTYIYQNPTAWQTWNYIGPGGGAGGSWANFPSAAEFSPGHDGFLASVSNGTPALSDHNTVGYLFKSNPEYFVPAGTAANYLTAFVQQPKYVKEQIDALYAMFNTRPIRSTELQAGVRWERTRDETKDFDPIGSAKVVAAGFPVTAATGVASTIPGIQYQYFSQPRIARGKSYDSFYPSASVKYSVTPNMQALFGYSYTVTRPAYGDLAGTYQENDTTQEITAPNPNLKPQYANNYSARVMYYFEPVGSVGVGAFENDFKNFTQTQRAPGAVASLGAPYDDPFYSNYTLISKQSIAGTVIYRGLTLEYNQSLSFLPEPFKGLTVFANYTRTYTLMRVPDPAQLHVSGSPYNFGWLPGVAPHVINYGVNYKYRRFTVGVRGRWTADTPTTSTYNTWMNQNTKIDANAAYSFSDRWSVYLSARNIFNIPDHTYIGTNRQQIGGGRSIEYYGAYFYGGIKARF
jgi:TonB-dependent receptor